VPSIDRERHQELVEKKDKNVELSRQEKLQLEKSWMELFYREPVSRDLIVSDDEGRLRERIRLFDEMLVDKRKGVRESRASLRENWIKHPINNVAVIGMLLEIAGVYRRKDETFELSNVIRSKALAPFAATCKTRKALIERVLDIEIRRDVSTKPVTQLNGFLKLIGLKAPKVGTLKQTDGTTVNEYRIDEAGYQWMVHFVEVRRRKPDNPLKRKKV